MRRIGALVVGACVLGCGASRFGRAGGAIAPLSVHVVEWNAARVDVGPITAVADEGDDLVTFGANVAWFRAGALVGSVKAVGGSWRGATSIAAPDGSGRWFVGVESSSDGPGATILRVKQGGASLESIADRYGFGATDVVASLADVGEGLVAFDGLGATSALLAIADRAKVTRYAYPSLHGLVGGGGKAAAFDEQGVVVIDPARAGDRRFSLEGVSSVALDAHAHLYASTEHAVYAEDAHGDLALVYESDAKIHDLVASRGVVWFADGGDLGSITDADGRTVVSATANFSLPSDAALFPSTSGDVWSVARGALVRYSSVAPAAADPERSWSASIAPVFARACVSCHGPAGPAGIDLSSFAAWRARKAVIDKRVLVDHTMPPKGHALSDADRAAIEAWIRAK